MIPAEALTTDDVSAIVGLTASAMTLMRHEHRGPAYYKGPGKNGRVYYLRADVEAWMEKSGALAGYRRVEPKEEGKEPT